MKPDMLDNNASILLHNSANSSNHTDATYNHHIFNFGDRIQNCANHRMSDLNNMRADLSFEANLGFHRDGILKPEQSASHNFFNLNSTQAPCEANLGFNGDGVPKPEQNCANHRKFILSSTRAPSEANFGKREQNCANHRNFKAPCEANLGFNGDGVGKAEQNCANHRNFNLSSTRPPFEGNFGKPEQNCANHRNFKAPFEANLGGDDDSGTETPPLWPRSPQHYRSLSPSSRAKAIERGQKELMEMVSKMPESCYELSLQDLVQRSPIVESKEEEKVTYPKSRSKSGKKVEMKRSESLDHNGGFLLRMVVLPPVPLFKSTKKKNMKNELSTTNTSGSNKVSPRPSVSNETNGVRSPDRKDWWKKRSDESRLSNNNGSRKSIGSNSSGSSSENRQGCWSFLRAKRKSKSTE